MMKCLLRCEQENISSCMIDTKTVPNKRFRSFIHYIERKYVGAYRIRPSRRRTCPFNDGIMFAAIVSFSPSRRRTRSLNDDVLIAAIVSIFAHLEGVCDTPLRFSCDAETTIFPHRDLRNYFTIRDELANEKPTSTGHQGYFRDWEPGLVKRAKSTCNLRKEDCFLRKTAIATAMEVDHLAQTVIANAEMKLSLRQSGVGKRRSEIVPCANAHRNCRNEIVPPTLRLRQSR